MTVRFWVGRRPDGQVYVTLALAGEYIPLELGEDEARALGRLLIQAADTADTWEGTWPDDGTQRT